MELTWHKGVKKNTIKGERIRSKGWAGTAMPSSAA